MDSSLRVPIVVGSLLTLGALATEHRAHEIRGEVARHAFKPEQVRLVREATPRVIEAAGRRIVVSRYSLELVDGGLDGQRTVDIEFATEPHARLDGLRIDGSLVKGSKNLGFESASVQVARNAPMPLEDFGGGLRFSQGPGGSVVVEIDLSGKGTRIRGKGTAKLVEL